MSFAYASTANYGKPCLLIRIFVIFYFKLGKVVSILLWIYWFYQFYILGVENFSEIPGDYIS